MLKSLKKVVNKSSQRLLIEEYMSSSTMEEKAKVLNKLNSNKSENGWMFGYTF